MFSVILVRLYHIDECPSVSFLTKFGFSYKMLCKRGLVTWFVVYDYIYMYTVYILYVHLVKHVLSGQRGGSSPHYSAGVTLKMVVIAIASKD